MDSIHLGTNEHGLQMHVIKTGAEYKTVYTADLAYEVNGELVSKEEFDRAWATFWERELTE